MKVDEAKQMEPYQVHLINALERIANALEKLVETDSSR